MIFILGQNEHSYISDVILILTVKQNYENNRRDLLVVLGSRHIDNRRLGIYSYLTIHEKAGAGQEAEKK